RLGYIMVGDAGIILARNPDRVRGPDVCYFSKERLPNGPPRGYSEIVPDLTVEVASPNDSMAEIRAKTDEWLRSGVRLAVTIFPGARTVDLTTVDGTRTLHEGDVFTGEPVLPNLSFPVAELFRLP
ncbi:MAG: Uma2 family endonuclease, partial [Dehalococcoidia bacterium]